MTSHSRPHLTAVLLLFFLSGFTGLVFQVLWMRELALLFGSTAQAAGATLGAFFLGLAAGGAYWGRRTPKLAHPLRTYALLELAVAASALLFFGLMALFHALYGSLYRWWGDQPGLFLAIKVLIAMAVLVPPTFFMGGTLPVLSQYVVRGPATLGRRVPLLYALNTLGAAGGVLLAAFVLPQALGYRTSYGVTIGAVLVIAAAAGLLALRAPVSAAAPVVTPKPAPGAPAGIGLPTIRALAFLSGFVTLALEVLWTRMFAQVLQNSVYTFAAVLMVFLVALALGALAARLIARRQAAPRPVLAAMLVAGALLTAATPQVFHHVTDGLGYVGAGTDWAGYVATVIGTTAVVLLPATLILGLVFPYLARVSEPVSRHAGHTVGELVALNTLGAIAGALGAAFLLLEWLGLWRSIQLMAALYLVAVLLAIRPLAEDGPRRARALVTAPAVGLMLLLTVLDSSRLPLVRIDPVGSQESIYEIWEGGGGAVAVVRRGDDLRTKVNNYYTLGGTAGRGYEERQAHFPLLLHPDPRSVFFIGLGTGITAGAALAHDVERVVAAELLPEAIAASRKYFRPWIHGLFDDPRATVIAADGRHHLAATPERYDVIIGDLFIPWRAGAGGLYTLEHFTSTRARLNPGGLFAQWLPLYQLSEREFGVITRTFLEAFDHVTLWRGDFLPTGPIVALVGHTDPAPLDAGAVIARDRIWQQTGDEGPEGADGLPLLLYYGGNLSETRELFAGYPLSTDDRPAIEFLAPVTQRAVATAASSWLTGAPLLELLEDIAGHTPWGSDPYLTALTPRQRATAEAGLALFRARFLEGRDRPEAARRERDRALALLAGPPAETAEPPTASARLRRELESVKAEYREQLRLMEQRLEDLSKEKTAP
ncbi:MAG: fused MFS/spermidine synthase [Gammaproteobacteria bacterium]|nr:fused MFS/spermidine synthase [Gammaproteobacteria bacterium]